MGIERVNGERFTTVELTPLLTALIEQAHQQLVEAVQATAPGLVVVANQLWHFDPGTEMQPSLLVSRYGEATRPELVVEFRVESTARYIMGPKRMVYGRHRVPDFWYVDPLRRRVAVLRSQAGEDYRWPPAVYAAEDVLAPAGIPALRVPVSSLVGQLFDRHPQAETPVDDDWLNS
ncbi:Uma2 family endonuclease [Streptomyces sp. NPDC057199]|uniref:Uma2 family endonuclease n=1 Tax=Streptomyces sp. NPDC057199 TaxID=3346047 RepID=UPI0036439E72